MGQREGHPRRLRLPRRRWARFTLLAAALLIVLVAAGSFFVDEPLRRAIEHQMNRKLRGYTARIERLSFHPRGFGVTLYGLRFIQDAHPEPPVLDVPRLDAGVQ